MSEDPLNKLLLRARQAQNGLDWESVSFPDFESRLAHRIQELDRQNQEALHGLWRGIGGCAVLVGILALWFFLTQAPLEAGDDLAVFWQEGSEILEM